MKLEHEYIGKRMLKTLKKDKWKKDNKDNCYNFY